MSSFVVRPSNSEKEAFRVKLTATSLLGLKLKPGDLCILVKDHEPEGASTSRSAVAWEASGGGMKDNIVQTSKFLQELYGFRLGDKITISKATQSLKDAEVVQLINKTTDADLNEQKLRFWETYATLSIATVHEYLARSQVISFRVGNVTQDVEIADLGVSDVDIVRVTAQTSFRFVKESTAATKVEFKPRTLGGLESEVSEVQRLISRLLYPKIPSRFLPIQGLLVYGAKGVGKSTFIEELCSSGWRKVIRWSPGAKVAVPTQPTIIIIDQIDLPSTQTASRPIMRELDRLFTSIRKSPCFVVGETRHPNDVDSYLRTEGKFASEIELPIPTASQRREILLAIRGDDPIPSDNLLQQIADRTHGYVGADLYALLRRVLELASERTDMNMGTKEIVISGDVERRDWCEIADIDIEWALKQIRPSALQEIFLETPNVRWSDIGGQHEIKRQLQNAVERPLNLADQMKKLGLKPKKGVLLYGPPGCSKTLLVRALATEAGLNFLAVKGAELISMYVGESERATREVFRKARAASPSIIFFDEIDAIASRGRSGSDLNVLTTLLNEMDGFEELKNVFVVAATNKPDSIDPALMRPGRFDNVVYIGPPDIEARTEIFFTQLTKSNYRTEQSIEEASKAFAAATNGFSGAEVVAVCQTAAEYALDDERDYLTSNDIDAAIDQTPKSISSTMLEEFESWNSARMRLSRTVFGTR